MVSKHAYVNDIFFSDLSIIRRTVKLKVKASLHLVCSKKNEIY
jgi:hypothetical protein